MTNRMTSPEYHNKCVICGKYCSCKGGIKVRIVYEDNACDTSSSAILCEEHGIMALNYLEKFVALIKLEADLNEKENNTQNKDVFKETYGG